MSISCGGARGDGEREGEREGVARGRVRAEKARGLGDGGQQGQAQEGRGRNRQTEARPLRSVSGSSREELYIRCRLRETPACGGENTWRTPLARPQRGREVLSQTEERSTKEKSNSLHVL